MQKSFLTYYIFDEQLKFVSGGADPVQPGGGYKLHNHFISNPVTVSKSGYIYVYVSNESNLPVYFDNLSVTHTPGPIFEETHYYPFGLTMAGISSRAAGKLQNRYKYNGYEENKTFDLNLYESFYRLHDPQLGRFWQFDTKPNTSESGYTAMGNNPVLYADPLGDTLWVKYKNVEIMYQQGKLYNQDGSAYGGKVRGFLRQTVNALKTGIQESDMASRMVNELEGSKNKFVIEQGDGDKKNNEFNPTPSTIDKAYANQINTDPSIEAQNKRNVGLNLKGGSGGNIIWNPNGQTVSTISGEENDPVNNLFHEIAHASSSNKGMEDSRITNGLERSEWQASYFENIIRGERGSPLRNIYHYNGQHIQLLNNMNLPVFPSWWLPKF